MDKLVYYHILIVLCFINNQHALPIVVRHHPNNARLAQLSTLHQLSHSQIQRQILILAALPSACLLTPNCSLDNHFDLKCAYRLHHVGPT